MHYFITIEHNVLVESGSKKIIYSTKSIPLHPCDLWNGFSIVPNTDRQNTSHSIPLHPRDLWNGFSIVPNTDSTKHVTYISNDIDCLRYTYYY